MTDKTYIGLLRGINVGGKVLKMADLTAAIADLGLSNIRTYLQSGNLLFTTGQAGDQALAARISGSIEERCGMAVTVLVRGADEWNDVIANNPFPQATVLPKTLHAFVLGRQPEKAKVDDLRSRDFGTEKWQIANDTLYLYTPDGFGRSKLGNTIERLLGVPMTGRNWNTVIALGELAAKS